MARSGCAILSIMRLMGWPDVDASTTSDEQISSSRPNTSIWVSRTAGTASITKSAFAASLVVGRGRNACDGRVGLFASSMLSVNEGVEIRADGLHRIL